MESPSITPSRKSHLAWRDTLPDMNPPAFQPRSSQLDRLFPQGVPGLWCDMLTHYTQQGEIDIPRTQAHARFLAPHVQGLLLAGPVNMGETMTPEQYETLLHAIGSSMTPQPFIMLGITSPPEMIQTSQNFAFVGWMANLSGAHGCDEKQAERALVHLLETGQPVGVVLDDDLPTADALGKLARRYENLLYVDDVAGRMDVIQSDTLPLGVFRFQGQEANYTRSLGSSGGPYHGLLLASANVFPAMLKEIVLAPALGQWDTSRKLSKKLGKVMDEVLAAAPPEGSLAMTCRAMDHHMAHGQAADKAPLPRFSTGSTLDASFVQAVGSILARHELLPEQGYLV